jgi:F-type H+-transporting ATPase subunit epsilon
MSEKFKVEVVTPSGIALDKEVEEIIAPGILGEFGVLIGHTPMLTFIKPGVFSYLEDGNFTKFAVGSGFCEVLKDSVSILVDEAVSEDEIDLSEAQSDLTELEKQLAALDSTADPDGFERVSKKLQLARTKVALAGGA